MLFVLTRFQIVPNRRFHIAIPFIYALRLYDTMDANARELNLFRKAILRVCNRVEVSAKLPGDITESIILDEPGHSIVVDSYLFVVGEYRESGPGFLTFWLSVAKLVAQLLGLSIVDEVAGILRCHTTSEMKEVLQARLGPVADDKLKEAKDRFDQSFKDDEEEDLPIPPPKPTEPLGQPTQPIGQTAEGAPPTTVADDSKRPVGAMAGFLPITGPADRPTKKRKIVITGFGDGGKRSRGPLATEAITFMVVEAFEKEQGRFTLPVSHLRGADAFGCDILSFASESIRDNAKIQRLAKKGDILRYIEVKGRSSRTGEIELPENEYKAAERETIRYFIYRVYVDPNRDRHYEVAVLGDPQNSKAVRNVTRFNLAEGSGAKWFKCSEVEHDGETD